MLIFRASRNRLFLALACGVLVSCAHVDPAQSVVEPSSRQVHPPVKTAKAAGTLTVAQHPFLPAAASAQATLPRATPEAEEATSAPNWGGFFWEIFGLPIALSLFLLLCSIAYVELRVMRRVRRLEGATLHLLPSNKVGDRAAKAS